MPLGTVIALGALVVSGLALALSRRDVQSKKTKDELADLNKRVEWLEDEKWIRGERSGGTGPGSGRPTTRFWINPKIQKKGGQGTVNTDVRSLSAVMAVPQIPASEGFGASRG